ncbi:hypothetical protein [Streptomyces sp. H39-S7]|uniref:hypothetical protein n=1 Tax=Streptomyces sp. H39-S7 TaxID=3004357 RepID=UPI0022B0240D|nr:hypothetical protein [Streptomyces sp. H39-S7]MCZ4120647.1 hypothetical protein [Streptomyces sp. H39-S7]
MATADFSATPLLSAPPMATPGFGKRSAPGQRPHSGSDFTHLPYREASIAAYIDQLPDGAAIDGGASAVGVPYVLLTDAPRRRLVGRLHGRRRSG